MSRTSFVVGIGRCANSLLSLCDGYSRSDMTSLIIDRHLSTSETTSQVPMDTHTVFAAELMGINLWQNVWMMLRRIEWMDVQAF